jgi:hypothetical protein
MNDEHTPSSASLAARHETTDVTSKPLALFALVLALAVALAGLFLIWLFGQLEQQAERRDPRLSPLVGNQTPPQPRLQTAPAGDLANMRAAEDRGLTGYRWIDKERGVVQLPIERAMDLLVEQGLPQTEPPQEEPLP